MLKFALPPTQNPNVSRWNIGCVGSHGIGTRVGHVHFMLFVSISFALGSQRKRSFQWNMGLSDKVRRNIHVPFHYQDGLHDTCQISKTAMSPCQI